eukprot:CAMPEP_0206008258 /NCGR_PEP_ID=MMETSP1464-20131121/7079_1 /ASSEMBLY_ACC=CAM_ASM_001124 /TAXON_ID=119497 /ORGANISM="Exanthemachrysis gayraliae, Strain RCC1523" /LENGTH=85 /DNA_ID=CAMNT_0053381789 /DNA_START=90 /DNA_END=343 /DNA_ORIENTATION=-
MPSLSQFRELRGAADPVRGRARPLEEGRVRRSPIAAARGVAAPAPAVWGGDPGEGAALHMEECADDEASSRRLCARIVVVRAAHP